MGCFLKGLCPSLCNPAHGDTCWLDLLYCVLGWLSVICTYSISDPRLIATLLFVAVVRFEWNLVQCFLSLVPLAVWAHLGLLRGLR